MKIWTASLDILTKMGEKYSVINSVDRKSVISTVITFRILGSNAVFKDCLSSKPKNLKCAFNCTGNNKNVKNVQNILVGLPFSFPVSMPERKA